MSTINAPNYKKDLTVRVFDNFNRFEQFVSAADFDIIYSYFSSVFATKEAASNFTTTIFRIAYQQQVSPLSIMKQLQENGTDQVKLTATIAYYLNNMNRSPSTLLGVGATQTPNYYAARNVLP